MFDGAIADLVTELGRLPGVGPKSAQRIAFFILQSEEEDVRRLADSMITVKEKVRFCSECGNVSEEERCRVCVDDRRDRSASPRLCGEAQQLARAANAERALVGGFFDE